MARLGDPKTAALILWSLLALFVLRVLGQAVVAAFEIPFLPPMQEWYSGVLPYPFLLPVQITLIALLAWVATDLSRQGGLFWRSRPIFRYVAWFGYFYAAAMAVRYIVQLMLFPERRWFGGTIPIAFHFVLAAYAIVFGLHHRKRSMAAH